MVPFDLVEEFTGCLYCNTCRPDDRRTAMDCNCYEHQCRRIEQCDREIVVAAEAAVDDWERGLKARENGNTLAVRNIQRVQQAVNAKREALGLNELVRLLGRAIEAAASSDAITDEETAKLREFAATLHKT
jgi:hypothetical protein